MNKIWQGSIHWVTLIFISTFAVGCSNQPATQQGLSKADRVNTAVAATLQALTQSLPTRLVTATPTPFEIIPEIELTSVPFEPKPTVEALTFDFPTQGPLPISAWRPPLYPVPWALMENDHFYFQRPIAANEINWPVANYRYGGMFFEPAFVHTGIDIDAPSNTPVLAAAEGKVIWAGVGLLSGVEGASDGYGIAVAIKHDFGFEGKRLYTVYAHMSGLSVVDNQEVKAGDQIGLVGTTGHTTGPHLHFEVRLGTNIFDNTRNPELWIAPPQGWGVLVGRIMDKNGKTLTHVPVHVESYETDHQWEVRTYGGTTVNQDDHYKENLVLSDLPAGKYKIWIDFDDKPLYYKFEIHPGAVTYLTFWGEKGFQAKGTATPVLDFLLTPTP
jgi:murein DD-endopeptidase MepM/ murein hydrolase activator NlpD